MIKKSKVIILAIITIAVLLSALVVVFIWKPFNNNSKDINNSQTTSTSTNDKTDVDTIKNQALKAANDNKVTEAKELYQKARQMYLDEDNIDAVIEIDAQIYKLNHLPEAPTPVTLNTSTAGGAGEVSQ